MNNLADIQLGPSGGFSGFGPLGNPQGDGVSTFAKFLSSMVGIITIIGVIWFLITFLTGVIGMIGSGGDKSALETSRKKISSAIIGLVVLIAAIFLIDLIGTIFGMPDILDLGKMFKAIQIK